MSRIESRLLSTVALAFLLVASGLQAQPSPGPGPWGSAHPVWFDVNGDGVPQPTELMGYPVQQDTQCTQVVGLPSGIPGTGTSSPCMFVYQSVGIFGSRSMPGGLVQSLSTNADGTVFTFTQEPYQQPPPTSAHGFRALAASVSGTGQLFDQNGDGIYDALQVEGTGVPQTRMSLLPKDVTGDGRPDYVTVPWTTSGAGLLGVFTDTTPQVYFPLTDTDQDGWPDTITVQVVGGISTTTGPPLSGPALVNGLPIPAASSVGLFAFAAAVVALGVKLLRGTTIAS